MPTTRLVPISIDYVTREYLSWLQDSENRTFLPHLPLYSSLSELTSDISSLLIDSSIYRFAIIFRDVHVGNIQYRIVSADALLLSILIGNQQFRGRGIGLSAVKLLISLLIDEAPQVRVLYAHIHPHNTSSIRLFRRCGFQFLDPRFSFNLPPLIIDSLGVQHLYHLYLTHS